MAMYIFFAHNILSPNNSKHIPNLITPALITIHGQNDANGSTSSITRYSKLESVNQSERNQLKA